MAVRLAIVVSIPLGMVAVMLLAMLIYMVMRVVRPISLAVFTMPGIKIVSIPWMVMITLAASFGATFRRIPMMPIVFITAKLWMVSWMMSLLMDIGVSEGLILKFFWLPMDYQLHH